MCSLMFLLIFLLMIPRLRRSTLFPYTTLFRSWVNGRDLEAHIWGNLTLVGSTFGQNMGLQLLDRKSTRLNSSHANISYAVFCLKKKKNATDHCPEEHEHCYRANDKPTKKLSRN